MLLLLIPLVFLSIWLISSKPNQTISGTAAMKAALILSALIWLGTEGISAFDALSTENITLFWTFLAIPSVYVLLKRKNQLNYLIADAGNNWKQLTWYVKIGGFISTLLVFLSGSLYPPNTWDSMTYHLSRIGYWFQNQNVSFYFTNNARQDYQPPLAEFAIMHMASLAGNWDIAFLLQFAAWLGLVIVIYHLALVWGSNNKGALLVACIFMLMPMSILEAASTQNDLVGTFYVGMACVFLWLGHQNNNNIFWAFLSIGLAILAKGTSTVFIGGIGIIWLLKGVLDKKWKTIWYAIIYSPVALLPNLLHWYRNFKMFAHPFGTDPQEQVMYLNQIHSPLAIISVMVRNMALHIGAAKYWNLNQGFKKVWHYFGANINNRATTFGQTEFDVFLSTDEDYAGNLFAGLLIMFGFYFAIRLAVKNRQIPWGLLTAAVSFFLFCFLFKWQPWHVRLHFPLFLTALAGLGFWLGKKNALIRFAIFACALVTAIPFLTNNHTHSLTSGEFNTRSRWENLFLKRKELPSDYQQISLGLHRLPKGFVLGTIIGNDEWIFPWFYSFPPGKPPFILKTIYYENKRMAEMKKEIPKIDGVLSCFPHGDTVYYEGFKYPISIKTPTACLYK